MEAFLPNWEEHEPILREKVRSDFDTRSTKIRNMYVILKEISAFAHARKASSKKDGQIQGNIGVTMVKQVEKWLESLTLLPINIHTIETANNIPSSVAINCPATSEVSNDYIVVYIGWNSIP